MIIASACFEAPQTLEQESQQSDNVVVVVKEQEINERNGVLVCVSDNGEGFFSFSFSFSSGSLNNISCTNYNNNKKKNVGDMIVECRICQEEDQVHAMEAPCACNGTLKENFRILFSEFNPTAENDNFSFFLLMLVEFAHRKCIQRWCNKKGDIICEICNQVFSPNYSLPPARTEPSVMAIDIRQAWGSHIDLRDSHI